MNPPVTSWPLGRVEYADGLELQRQFLEARRVGASPDTVLLLEHPPVLTLGRGAKRSNVLVGGELLRARGIELFETDRGGDVTYHGPGQLVGYPLLHLGPGRQDVRRYVRAIEELVIRTVRDFGIEATRLPRWPGVWVERSRAGGPRKIAALGVHLSRWYTSHGFALNVDPDLSHFALIVPCGITEGGVTSMAQELGRPVAFEIVRERIVAHIGEVFECAVEAPPPLAETVSVVIRSGDAYLLLRRTPTRGGFWQPVTGRVERGEALDAAAARELREETAFDVPVRALDYQHAFAWGREVPPRVARETGFVAVLPERRDPRLGEEHDAFEWVDRPTAMARVPFAGFRRAIELSAALDVTTA